MITKIFTENPPSLFITFFLTSPVNPLYKQVENDEGWLAYEGDRGLRYGREHDRLCDTFYRGAWDAKIPLHYDRPSISVVMAAYNAAHTLSAAVDRIWNQTFQDFEIILVDDGSTDDTPKVSEALAAEAKRKGRIFRTIHNDTNRGLAYSKNRGIEIARGRYIANHDADDVSRPCRFEREYEFLENHPDYIMVGTSYYMQHMDRKPTIIHLPNDDNSIRYGLSQHNTFGHGSTILIRTEVLKRVMYDETIKNNSTIDWPSGSKQTHFKAIEIVIVDSLDMTEPAVV